MKESSKTEFKKGMGEKSGEMHTMREIIKMENFMDMVKDTMMMGRLIKETLKKVSIKELEIEKLIKLNLINKEIKNTKQ